MPCVCDAPCVEVDGAETCTLCGLERARWFGIPTNNDDENNKNENKNDNDNNKENKKKSGRRVAEYRRYVGSLAINETVAGEAVGLYERLVVARGLVFRGLRNVAVRLACVAAALDTTSSSVKHTAVVADTAECARYGYARLRRALDRALDAVLGPRACFVGASKFDVDVGAYQRAVAQLGCAHTLVRACTRLDAECFTPSERARYKDTNLQKAVLLSVATGPYDTVGRARLGLNARTATTVRRLIDRRSSAEQDLPARERRSGLRVLLHHRRLRNERRTEHRGEPVVVGTRDPVDERRGDRLRRLLYSQRGEPSLDARQCARQIGEHAEVELV